VPLKADIIVIVSSFLEIQPEILSVGTTFTMASGLPPCNRHIATHNADGKSVYADFKEQAFGAAGAVGFMARSWAVANVPAKLSNDEDMKAYLAGPESVTSFQRPEIVVPPEGGKNNGANLLVVDLNPGKFTQMHQTVSIDYSICCIGTIIHELDSGERVTLKPGVCAFVMKKLMMLTSWQDHIVQRGTNHRWINASKTEPARFLAVTMPCEPFDVAGKQLKEVHMQDSEGYEAKL